MTCKTWLRARPLPLDPESTNLDCVSAGGRHSEALFDGVAAKVIHEAESMRDEGLDVDCTAGEWFGLSSCQSQKKTRKRRVVSNNVGHEKGTVKSGSITWPMSDRVQQIEASRKKHTHTSYYFTIMLRKTVVR